MCWNQEVSLNTFLFSSFVLGLVIYNNAYTQYKLQEFNNLYVYLTIFSTYSMQLIEFFLWRNLNNKFYIHIFSTIGILLVFLQPLFSIMILSNLTLRWRMLSLYLLLSVPLLIYKLYSNDYSVKVMNGHLYWDKWFDKGILNIIKTIIYVFFMYFSLIVEKKYSIIIFTFTLMIWSFYNFLKNNNYSSMWCWSVNSLSIYMAFLLLFYLPFSENAKC